MPVIFQRHTESQVPSFRIEEHRPSLLQAYGHNLGLLVLAVGIFFLTLPLAIKGSEPATISAITAQLQQFLGVEKPEAPILVDTALLREEVQASPPTRIMIPTLAIDLPVIPANIVNGFWELSETTASYGKGSGSPGSPGNTVIFAHARRGLFLPIRDMKTDTAIYVQTEQGWHEYVVTETKLVEPSQIEVIAPTDDETLTLYTCTGFMDSKRQIVIAKPQKG